MKIMSLTEDAATATVFIELKKGKYSVHIILTPFDKAEDAENVAEMMSAICGVHNIIPPKRELH